jgi:hypothetical protein
MSDEMREGLRGSSFFLLLPIAVVDHTTEDIPAPRPNTNSMKWKKIDAGERYYCVRCFGI